MTDLKPEDNLTKIVRDPNTGRIITSVGRPKGVKNKNHLINVAKVLAEYNDGKIRGFCPVKELISLCKHGNDRIRLDAATVLLKYSAIEHKAVEMSAEEDTGIQVNIFPYSQCTASKDKEADAEGVDLDIGMTE